MQAHRNTIKVQKEYMTDSYFCDFQRFTKPLWKISNTSKPFHRSNISSQICTFFKQSKDQLISSQLHCQIQGNGAAMKIEGARSYWRIDIRNAIEIREKITTKCHLKLFQQHCLWIEDEFIESLKRLQGGYPRCNPLTRGDSSEYKELYEAI